MVEQRPFKPMAKSSNPPTNKELTESDPSDLAENLALVAEKHPELAKIIEAWPDLPSAIRSAIMAIVRTSKGYRADGL